MNNTAATATHQAPAGAPYYRYIRLFKIAVSIFVIGAAAMSILGSWRWPMALDSPLMHYIAFLIDHGKVPYAQIIDFNGPGAYLLHWLVIHTLGGGDLAWRMFDLLLLAVGAVSIFSLTRRFGSFAGILGSAVLICVHIAKGIDEMGERDFIAGIFMLAAAALLVRATHSGHSGRWFAFGFSASFAITVKPSTAVFLFAFTCLGLYFQWREQRLHLRPWLWAISGAALPMACIATYLAAVGGLHAFAVTYTEFLPIYVQIERRPSLAKFLVNYTYALWPLLLGATAGVIACRVYRRSEEHLTLFVGIMCGLLSYWVQRKGWAYHIDPAVIFMGVWATTSLAALLHERSRLLPALAIVSVLTWLTAVPEMVSDIRTAEYPLYSVDKMKEEITALRAQGKSHGIQVMDTASGCLQSLYDLKLVQSTGFTYDFYFYSSVDHPFVQSLRSRFIGEITATQPDLIVMSNQQWPRKKGFDRIERWPEFASFLKDHYTLQRSHPWYRIYVHN
jgi:hypothetical protein